MWNDYDAVRPSRYSNHFGHRAWPFYSKSVEGAVIEDLFWRKVQTDPDFAVAVARTIWPQSERMKGELLLNSRRSMSLLPESCGAYTFGAWGGLYTLRGDASDTRRIEMGQKRASKNGYYLGPLAALHKGWLDENVVVNILGAMKSRLSASDRFRFHEKACHRQVLMTNINWDACKTIIESAYPVMYNFLTWRAYWYRTEKGSIIFGVIYYIDSKGNVHKLPISAWQEDYAEGTAHVYDMLNIAPPYPLYDLDMLVRYDEAQYALICNFEATVEHIKRYFAWIPHCWPVTTYTAIDATDWNPLRGKTPIIFPDATAHGCREAFQLAEALSKNGFSPRFLKRHQCAGVWSQEFVQDLGRLAERDGECTLPEFDAHCRQEYGVEPPAGILPKAIPLSALPEPAGAPEPLMDGLLDAGELMMVYAWRGLGKSLFAMLLALCFVSGKSALNGRICPSRKYRVLVLDGEMSSHSLKKRGRRLCLGHELPEDANDEVMVRSKILENNKLTLETEEGRKEYNPDLEWADIIIVDPMYKFFPEAMESEFSAVDELLDFLEWCRLNRKTLILIDHEGKSRGTSFGTMGMEIALDVVLRLCHSKSPHMVEAHVQKVRDHAEPMGAYVKMRIEADSERIAYQVCDDRKGEVNVEAETLGADGGAESQDSSAARTPTLDEAIRQYVREHPEKKQADVVRGLQTMGYTQARSTINEHIKKLADEGKLPSWKNAPEAPNAAGQAGPEDAED